MKLALFSATICAASAFAPSASYSTTSALSMSEAETTAESAIAEPEVPAAPLVFSKDQSLEETKRFREAEIMHGRVAMMATLGYLIGESTPTITYGMDVHHTIANNQIPEIPGTVLFPFFLAVNFVEALRANVGWVEPGLGPLFTLREKYYPGD